MLLCLLIISNIATYIFTRFFFSPTVLEVEVPGQREESGLFWEVWNILDGRYFQPLEEKELMRGAIKGMLESLNDPHSAYLTPESFQELLIHATGSLSGIGVEIVEDEGEILILRVIKDSPAQRGGLSEGDRIVEVDGRRGLLLDEAVQLLRGPSGTTVNVVVRRLGEQQLLPFDLKRADIEMDTVFSRMIEDGIGYIQITSFDQDTGKDFLNALALLEENNLRGLIFDLRSNPGGLADEAIEVGKVIVPSGEITRVVDRSGNIQERFYSEAEKKDYKIVVLVNEYTASAAEIIAGALQDREKALLIGLPTFGKASMQYLQFLSDGGGLRYTIAKYLTPSGGDWHGRGLTPDFEVTLPDEYYLQYQFVPGNLKPGDTGERVIQLQKMLTFLGYPVKTTGLFDDQTVNSLMEFQRINKLVPTGSLENSTREHLRSGLSEKAAEVDNQLQYAVDILKGK